MEDGDALAEVFSSNRSAMQKLKLDVHVAQILERVAIRKKSLESLLEQELGVSTKLANVGNRPGCYELESELERILRDIDRERRMEDANCWRDLTHVMRDFLSVMEALEAAKGRDRMLDVSLDREPDFKYQLPEGGK